MTACAPPTAYERALPREAAQILRRSHWLYEERAQKELLSRKVGPPLPREWAGELDEDRWGDVSGVQPYFCFRLVATALSVKRGVSLCARCSAAVDGRFPGCSP